MSYKNNIINIIGQLRIYSLIDLILLAFVLGYSNLEIFGIILLHISFLFYLEYTHKHSYRFLISKYIWIIIGILGIIIFNNLVVIGYIIFSVFYVRKDSKYFGLFSPFARGFQNYFISAGSLGFLNPISFYVFSLFFVRNFAGDLRDITKDKEEGMETLAIFLGFKNDYKYIHLATTFMTSFFWWYIGDISVLWLGLIFLIQILTYKITTR